MVKHELEAVAEVQLVTFQLEREEFALDIHQVREVLRMVPVTPLPNAAYFIEGVINLRGEVVPVLDLRKRFDLPSEKSNGQNRIIVVESGEYKIGLIVDYVTEVLRLPSTAIQPPPNGVVGTQNDLISGIGKAEKRLLIILNLDRVLDMGKKIALKDVILSGE